jgi:quercetin dioxygenase-like cupin family protein
VSAKGMVRPAQEAEARPVERAKGAWVQVLVGPVEGAENFVLRKFTLEPGGCIPLHRHPAVEHEQYVLSGRIRLTLGAEVREVGPGHVVFIPAGAAHRYENVGPAPAEFLCVVPRTAAYETEWME